MSIKHMNAVWSQAEVDQTTLLVLLSLADQANDEGRTWPSVAHLAQRARCSERHVRRILKELEESGWLRIEHRAGRSSMYWLTIPTPDTQVTPDVEVSPDPRVTPDKLSPLTPRSPHPGHPGQGTPDTQVTQNHKEPPKNPDTPDATHPLKAESAQTLIGEWIDFCKSPPPGRVKGHVAKELKTMLDEGIAYEQVRAGLAAWAQRGNNPSSLASFVHEVGNPRKPKQAQEDRIAYAHRNRIPEAWV